MKAVVIIPARMKSSRFPGKPLANILGLPMVEHVRRRCLLAKGIKEVIIATCDKEIESVVALFGGKVIMTSRKHFACTDRIAEASKKISTDIIVNVQADEPTVMPHMIEKLIGEFKKNKDILCVNLMVRINNKTEFNDTDIIKVALDNNGFALYFSRASIPFFRFQNAGLRQFKQTGLYAYRKDFLDLFSKLKPTKLEIAEGIDMLRALENGYKIKMKEVRGCLIGVDTPQALVRAKKIIKKSPLTKQYFNVQRFK